MTAKKASLILLGLLAIALVMVVRQRGELLRLEKDHTTLRDHAAELEQRSGEHGDPSKADTDSEELARLRAEHSELLRLRGEIGRLRQQLKSQAAANPNLNEQPPPSPIESPVETFTANVDAELTRAQTLVTGGWETSPGKRTFILIEPTLIDPAGNEVLIDPAEASRTQILVQSKFIEVPEQALQTLGLNDVVADGHQSSERLVLSRDQSLRLLKALGDSPGMEVLSAPRITTLNGRQAQVSVAEEKRIGNETYHLGPSIKVLPQISPTGQSIKLTVNGSISREALRK